MSFSTPIFTPGLKVEMMSSLLELEHKQKIFSNAFRIFLFPSYSFGIETINTFIRFRSSLENHTGFYNKSVYPFSDQNGPKTTPLGVAHTYNGLYKVVPPTPPTTPEDIQQLFERILL